MKKLIAVFVGKAKEFTYKNFIIYRKSIDKKK